MEHNRAPAAVKDQRNTHAEEPGGGVLSLLLGTSSPAGENQPSSDRPGLEAFPVVICGQKTVPLPQEGGT